MIEEKPALEPEEESRLSFMDKVSCYKRMGRECLVEEDDYFEDENTIKF